MMVKMLISLLDKMGPRACFFFPALESLSPVLPMEITSVGRRTIRMWVAPVTSLTGLTGVFPTGVLLTGILPTGVVAELWLAPSHGWADSCSLERRGVGGLVDGRVVGGSAVDGGDGRTGTLEGGIACVSRPEGVFHIGFANYALAGNVLSHFCRQFGPPHAIYHACRTTVFQCWMFHTYDIDHFSQQL